METTDTTVYRDEHLVLDFEQRTVAVDSEVLTLTYKEYALIAFLVQRSGEIVPRQVLLSDLWGYGPDIRTRTLDVHIRRLRRKIGAHADRYIETIFGSGYRFQPFHAPRFDARWFTERAA
jgi:two-component system phosphate regulon response regulator PhoB